MSSWFNSYFEVYSIWTSISNQLDYLITDILCLFRGRKRFVSEGDSLSGPKEPVLKIGSVS